MSLSMSITRTVFAISACYWLSIGAVEAEFIGLNMPGDSAQSAQSVNSSSIDLVDDLDVDNPAQTSMVLILEHPISALPNIRYQSYNMGSSDSPSLSRQFSFNQGSLGVGGDSNTSYDLANNDLVLYYQLLNNWMDLNMGVDLKRLDGQVSQSGPGNNINIDETIPLFHLSARVDLPINGLFVGANINTSIVNLGISESGAQDSTIMLGFENGTGLGIAGGIKSFSLELDNSTDSSTDLGYDGLFVNGYLNF
jgi:outer membrane protein